MQGRSLIWFDCKTTFFSLNILKTKTKIITMYRLCLVVYFILTQPLSAYILFNFFNRILAVQKRHHVGGNRRVGIVQANYLVTVVQLDSQPSTTVDVFVLHKSHCSMITAAEMFVSRTSTSQNGAVQEPTRHAVEIHFVFSMINTHVPGHNTTSGHENKTICRALMAMCWRERINTSVSFTDTDRLEDF